MRERWDATVVQALDRLPSSKEVDSWPLHHVVGIGVVAVGLAVAHGGLVLWEQAENLVTSFNDARRAAKKG